MNGGVMAGALLLDLRHFEREAAREKTWLHQLDVSPSIP